jgi:lipid-A-disaccharide synthase
MNEEARRKSRHLAIVAGEASGDTHGAALMRSLKEADPSIRFTGKGGPKMADLANAAATASNTSLDHFDNWIAEAGVLGLWDVLCHYGYFKRKFDGLLAELAADPPQALILVDYPGFNLRLAKSVRKRGIPTKIIYYISPQVWAWNRRRIPEMARNLDLMICIFPFERDLYESSGLHTVFAGHPMAEELHAVPTEARDATLLGLFPGSRTRELLKIFPAMLGAAERVQRSRPDIRIEAAAATAAHAEILQKMAADRNLDITVSTAASRDLMRRAAVGLVCSGTATLEAACLGLPYALVYRVAWLTYEVGIRVIRVPYLGIVNILANRPVIREFIQENATPATLADEALRLLNSREARDRLSLDLATVVATLGGRESSSASERAAAAVLECLDQSSTASH